MSSHILTATKAARHFSEYISRVTYRRETVVLRKGRKPVAERCPLPRGRHLGDLPSVFRSLPPLAEGDADQFAEDVDAARDKARDEVGLREVTSRLE